MSGPSCPFHPVPALGKEAHYLTVLILDGPARFRLVLDRQQRAVEWLPVS